MIRIAVDAMGGDYAPEEIVRGAVWGARDYQTGIILVGNRRQIKPLLDREKIPGTDIEILHTDEYLVEGEAPAYALRTKRKASIALATRLVKEGNAGAVVAFGPTGGVIAAALTYLGTMNGLSRPVIGGNFCGLAPEMVMMDMGGNLDVKPYQLLDFAIVGTVYAHKILGVEDPKVGLLSVGFEEGKGNEVSKTAFPLLRASGLNFVGNIEGNDILGGHVNVVICDGFIGNIVVKYSEGLGSAICRWLTRELNGQLPDNIVRKLTAKLLKITVPADSQGGGPLWGVNGLVFKGHGRSRHPEIARTIGEAKQMIEMDLIGSLRDELDRVKSRINLS